MKIKGKNLKKLALLILTTNILLANCWSGIEQSYIAEKALDDITVISFKNASNCKPIKDVKVSIGNMKFSTDKNGYIEIPTPSDMDDMKIPFTASKNRFIPLKLKLKVMVGDIVHTKFLMSPSLAPDSVRFVLRWKDKPKDLDLHLKGDGYHISYQNRKIVRGKAKLDIDSTNGFGPETITVKKVNKNSNYSLYVKNYSNEAPITDTVVDIYKNNRLYRSVDVNSRERVVEILSFKGNDFVFKQ